MSIEEKFVTLVSPDGYEFVLPFEATLSSNLIRNILYANVKESVNRKIDLPEIPSPVLSIVSRYMLYKYIYSSASVRPEFTIPPSLSVGVLKAAHYLEL
ncbi:hypothetical protein GEMRC1_002994 [Eukaryota sp. GEM-RC1]